MWVSLMGGWHAQKFKNLLYGSQISDVKCQQIKHKSVSLLSGTHQGLSRDHTQQSWVWVSPDEGLARPKMKKSTVRMSSLKCQVPAYKTQKCQPPVRDTPGATPGTTLKGLGCGLSLMGGWHAQKNQQNEKSIKNIK